VVRDMWPHFGQRIWNCLSTTLPQC
jgi:hypothetical protein